MQKLSAFLLAAMYFSVNAAFAQQPIEKPPEKTKFNNKDLTAFKWDASLNVYQLFRSGSGTLMLRYAPHKNGAYRLSLGLLNSGTNKYQVYQDSLGSPSTDPYVFRKIGRALEIQLGYERQKNVGRHQLFFGMDAQAYYSYDHSQPSMILPIRMYVLSAIPFVGIKYRILNRLSVSAETGASFSVRLYRNLDFDKNIIAKQTGYFLSFESLRVINLSYHF
ncbi:hypothetical protein [Dyadobacter luticola]|uniref:DUF3575 domain-containing protein n=1 Tax=Dyadobacter luticola TaxID=1979387 RepID=A0A5R9KSK0_9BACT|nr:hypothetical protein [Dyadobacter luticola]TLU99084.1 hypothetical protein FEN17_21130 [Dyadobacter luticola]